MRKRTISLLLGAAAVAGTVASGGAAEALTSDSAYADVTHHVVWQAGEISVKHVPNHGFNTYFWDGVSWRASVTVDYGRSGAWTVCSDGTEIHGPLQGPGFWDFRGSCSGHGTVTTYGWYDG